VIALPWESFSGLGGITSGWSDEARQIERECDELRQHMEEAFSLRFGVKHAREDLGRIARDCAVPGWDGADAAPLEPRSVAIAERLLDALPDGLPAPAISAEPDGQVTCEWYQSARRVVSLSIDPEGFLHYAALLGPRRAFGTELFAGALPRRIADLIWGALR
jgi:hypothetical protein